ncbi:uncharacterized protein RAG0_15343 [Rhynchosporium agropyri]|uniref:BTB domain-containing protein n=1 Tax=Rhynchosporium agropyri TaxID=914238 RepID=A0A1E1LKQ7_9HELO|nr:uncharacterized protein RAG0_15343 [Rhynchosporium agropyri]
MSAEQNTEVSTAVGTKNKFPINSRAEVSYVNKPSSSTNSGNAQIRDSLDNEFVTIYVGPKRQEFIIIKKLLCQSSDFFDKAFNSNFQEASEGTMHLPDDNSEAFALFSHISKLADLYILVDKICLADLSDAVMDLIQDLAFDHRLDDVTFVPLIDKLWKTSIPFKGLIRFFYLVIIDTYVERSWRSGVDSWEQFIRMEDMKSLWKLSRDSFKAFSYAMERKQYKLTEGMENSWDSRDRDISDCFFHCHKLDEVCYEMEEFGSKETDSMKDVSGKHI